jgi:transcription elongation GreA/GreB family factor
MMDKRYLIAQLRQKIADSANIANTASSAAAQQAQTGATPREQRQDSRVAMENTRMARAQAMRAQKAEAELAALDRFNPVAASGTGRRVGLGSLVEIEDDEGLGRTIFVAPAGAGTTLTGPGGDGFLSVVTPTSPVGRAIRGRLQGDEVDVTVKGEVREWVITYVD